MHFPLQLQTTLRLQTHCCGPGQEILICGGSPGYLEMGNIPNLNSTSPCSETPSEFMLMLWLGGPEMPFGV